MYFRLDHTHASILDRAAAHCDGNATEALRRLLREWDAADKEGQAFTATRSKNEVAAQRPKVLSSSTPKQEERGLRCLDCKVPHGACRVCGSSEAELAERGHLTSDGGRVLCQGRVAK